jgi:superfamily II DNA or RNA helicase
VVEFTDARRTVALPVRAALPVLTRAHARDDLHPTVALLSGAALLGMRLVAAGRLEPDPGGQAVWRLAGLDDADEDRVLMLARARAHEQLPEQDAEALVRRVLDAVADAVPRSAPSPRSPTRGGGSGRPGVPGRGAAFTDRLRERLESQRLAAQRPQLVSLSLRVEADEEELLGGAVRLVLQVHDAQDPLHVRDAALLWTGDADVHGFGERARTHAGIALRAAAEAWPVLDRLLELGVPDQITLDSEELVSLLEDGVTALAARGVDVLWPRALGRDLTTRAVLDKAPGRSGAREGELVEGLLGVDDLFAFRWQVALHGDPLTEAEMEQLAASASPLVRLRGGWTVVDPAVARRARKRLIRTVRPAQAVAAALTGVVEVPPAQDGAALDAPVVVGASLLAVRERLLAAASREQLPVPSGLAATLRGYQRQGLTWLAELTDLGLGACLADDMGLGKTVTLIALHLHRAQAAGGTAGGAPGGAAGGAAGPTLVVCPASLLGNWEAEIARFAPGVPVRRFHGGGRSLSGVRAGFVLTTYGTLRNDQAALAEVGWDLVVADEAQHVKNARSATARALRAVPGRARVALTGTPVENDLTELWSILDWLVPGLLGSRQAFRRVWAAPIESGLEPTKARQFADLIGPFLLRRRKSDPGIAPELPAKTETDHLLGLTREQVVLYETFVRDTMARIERADELARRGLVLALLTGLKQICNHPAHFLRQQAVPLAGRSQKLDLLDELVATILAEGGAALVFTQYVAMGRLLESHLARMGVPHQFLHGGTPVREREAMVARFQAGDVEAGSVPVFLLSLKAGGTGLNLTRADHVIHVDRWWNPAVEEQATDRAYRIGQTRPVQVHRLVTRGTIEERIAELLRRKQAVADAVLARGEAALTELSNEDLRDLVTLRQEARRAGGP